MAGERQRSSAGKGSTLAGHPGHRDFYSLPVKSLPTGRCGANAASFHLEAKHREVLGRKMAEWALPGTRKGQHSVSCRVLMVSASKNQKAKKTVAVSRGERGQMYFSPCVFHLARTRFLSLALLFVGSLPHVVGISEYKNGLRSHRKPDPSKLVFLQHLQKPRALSQARRRDQWLALLAWA